MEKILRCPLRWMLERHGGGEVGALSAVTGTLVHALVQAGAQGAGAAELENALHTAWAQLDLGAPWLRRVAVEHSVQRDLPGEPGDPEAPTLRLRGRVDRLEVDAAGRPVVVDVKTGRTAVSARAAAEHAQLAVYQLAAALGAFTELVGAVAEPGGARLVYLADRSAQGAAKQPVQAPLQGAEVERWSRQVRAGAVATAGARFRATVGPDCERCPVRASCPASESGRSVPEG